ncbi:hypothetical protein N7490_001619 [Penicillium lividum]|nr:hypothetical protein N7490_001619 [Penicillium lividum]
MDAIEKPSGCTITRQNADDIADLMGPEGWVNVSIRTSKSLESLQTHASSLVVPTSLNSTDDLPYYGPHPEFHHQKLLIASIANYTIGFDLKAFPESIKQWFSDFDRNQLPGTYGHLLMLMFADEKEYVELQVMMGHFSGWDFLKVERELVTRVDQTRNFRAPWDEWPLREPATLQLKDSDEIEWRDDVEDGRKRDELKFGIALRTLRDLVAPLRDPTEPNHTIFWIQGREDQPDSVLEEWEWSKDLIDDFKKRIVETEWNRVDNPSIYHSYPQSCDENYELQQKLGRFEARTDACICTMMWDEHIMDRSKYPERGPSFYKRASSLGGLHATLLSAIMGVQEPPKIPIPTVQVSENLGHDIDNEVIRTENGQLLNMLVQLAEWLALARGYPAVKMFTEITRLFTVLGVDLANAPQVELCKYLIKMRLPGDADYLVRNRIQSLHAWYPQEPNRDYLRGFRRIIKYFGENHRESNMPLDNEAISWTFPLQLLEWRPSFQGPYLVKKRMFPRCHNGPDDFVDEARDSKRLELQARIREEENNPSVSWSPFRSCSYPIFNEEELSILLDWQALNEYRLVREFIQAHEFESRTQVWEREGELDRLFDRVGLADR